MTRRAFDIIFYRGSKCFPLKAGPALGLGHLGYGLWPPNIERSPLIWGGKSTHSRCGKCAKCQIFVTFATPNTKNTLPPPYLGDLSMLGAIDNSLNGVGLGAALLLKENIWNVHKKMISNALLII